MSDLGARRIAGRAWFHREMGGRRETARTRGPSPNPLSPVFMHDLSSETPRERACPISNLTSREASFASRMTEGWLARVRTLMLNTRLPKPGSPYCTVVPGRLPPVHLLCWIGDRSPQPDGHATAPSGDSAKDSRRLRPAEDSPRFQLASWCTIRYSFARLSAFCCVRLLV